MKKISVVTLTVLVVWLITGLAVVQGDTDSTGSSQAEIQKGDINRDDAVDLSDAILILQIISGSNPSLADHWESDVSGDGKIGVEEALYALRSAAEAASATRRQLASLNQISDCNVLLTELKERFIAQMEEKLDQNLNYILETGGCGWPGDLRWIDFDLNYISTTRDDGAKTYSETNVQVPGVDEADFIKNDGAYIYILADSKLHIVDAWPPGEAHLISSADIEGLPKKLFVSNKKAFVYSSLEALVPQDDSHYPYYLWRMEGECTYGYDCEFTGDGRKLKITILDISNVAGPRLIRELYFSSSYLNSRRVNDAVHTVVIFPEPVIQGVQYWPEAIRERCWERYSGWWDVYCPEGASWCNPGTAQYDKEEIIAMFEALKKRNKEVILATDLTAWLPTVKDIRHGDGQSVTEQRILGDCGDFYLSRMKEKANFLSLISTDINGKNPLSSSTIVGKPGAVYASADSFYVASRHSRYDRWPWFFADQSEIREASTIHKFSLKNDQPASAYIGSTVVKGKVLNQFSMDEYDGYFRIVTTTGRFTSLISHSTISVIQQEGDELVLIGQLDGIAPTEDIRSARFNGNKAFVVTFKKTDPLFAIDLSDPVNPTVAGELKIPGFSTYIHPMDETHLLSIGYDADEQGSFAWFQGIMLQQFDVADLKNPQLIHKEIIGTRGSTSDATTNHLAFNYFGVSDLLAIPMVVCEGGSGGSYGDIMTFSGLMVYRATTESGFEYLGGVSHEEPETPDNARGACINWWTRSNSMVKRSIFMDDYVFSITETQIKVNKLSGLGTDIAVVDLMEQVMDP